MWIDWKRKKRRFNLQDKRVTLTGVKDRVEHYKLVNAKQLFGWLNQELYHGWFSCVL